MNINSELAKVSKKVDKFLISKISNSNDYTERLSRAMHYSAIGSGKRVRAFLLIESARLVGGESAAKKSLPIAVALELIHTYSLIHDDLPSMDNSPLRRGKPSLHIKFDEATAILAGDALQSLGFEIIAKDENDISESVRLKLIYELAKSIGYKGMAQGQMLDLIAEKRFNNFDITNDYINLTQQLKTGALISFALRAGGLIGDCSVKTMQQLISYGSKIGLAFQIIDDVLDCKSTEHELGKQVKSDRFSGKGTFVDFLGMNESIKKVHNLIMEAKKDLKDFGIKRQTLSLLADFIELRKY